MSAPAEQPAAGAARLDLHVAPTGAAAERAIAELCARHGLRRDGEAPAGAPAARADCTGGDYAVDLLVHAATHALDDVDLHLTLRRR